MNSLTKKNNKMFKQSSRTPQINKWFRNVNNNISMRKISNNPTKTNNTTNMVNTTKMATSITFNHIAIILMISKKFILLTLIPNVKCKTLLKLQKTKILKLWN